jgi:hypothetical protein
VVRDWFKMVLWYVRLRRASQTGQIHTALREVERYVGPLKSIKDPKQAVKEAKHEPSLSDHSQEGRSSEFDDDSFLWSEAEEFAFNEDENLKDQIKKRWQEAMMRSNKVKAEFFNGIKF